MPGLNAGDRSDPAADVIGKILAALPFPFPSDPTPLMRRALLLRRLAADPVSLSAVDTLQELASLPDPAPQIAAAHTAVAAFLAASAPDFDAVASALFAYPNGRASRGVNEGGSPALATDQAIATVDQFEAAVGYFFSQTVLRSMWDSRPGAEARVRVFLAAEWAAIEPSLLAEAADRITGDELVETCRAADEATSVKLRAFVGKENTREILGKHEEPTSSANPISTPAAEKEIDALKTSCADLHSLVENLLPATKAVADEVLAARLEKRVSMNAAEVRGQPTTCGTARPTAPNPNDKYKGPSTGKPRSLMDWNPTARTFQWEESPGPDCPESSSAKRVPVSSFRQGENNNKRRRTRKKWSLLEEETLRKGVGDYGVGNWKNILNGNPDVFIGRTAVDLKDKWRNMIK